MLHINITYWPMCKCSVTYFFFQSCNYKEKGWPAQWNCPSSVASIGGPDPSIIFGNPTWIHPILCSKVIINYSLPPGPYHLFKLSGTPGSEISSHPGHNTQISIPDCNHHTLLLLWVPL